MWEPNDRYPDPAVQALDASFAKYRLPLASVERLATGCRWSEGPVYFGDGRYLLWSDIPNDRIMRWDEETGAVSVFSQAVELRQWQHARSARPTGLCEHGGRRVSAPNMTARSPCWSTRYRGQAAELAE